MGNNLIITRYKTKSLRDMKIIAKENEKNNLFFNAVLH